MSAAHPHLAEIDAAIARGEWWRRLFDELSDVGMKQAETLSATGGKGLARVALDFCRIARAVRMAIVAAMRLDDILRGLAELRHLAPEAIAAARARAEVRAEEVAAAREKARARRETPEYDQDERDEDERDEDDGDEADCEEADGEEAGHRERDPLVEALDKRLTVDPAGVDFDDLQLRETVLRICADLKITPDWCRWEAGDWNVFEPPPPTNPGAMAETTITAPKVRPPPSIQGLPGLTARATDTAMGHVLRTGPTGPSWPRPRLE